MPGRSRVVFWAFLAVIAAAVAGGALIVRLARENVAERKGHPDTIAPAERAGGARRP